MLQPQQSASRGTELNPTGRYEKITFVADPDGPQVVRMEGDPDADEDLFPSPKTEFFKDTTKTIITYNDSPDIPYEAGLNPYRGCEHGCIYCYARPYHEYLGLSAGLDFESKIFVKLEAAKLLRKELSAKSWQPQQIHMSGVTDLYQPVERVFKLTRSCLEVLAEFRNPVGIITKNALITRDIEVLSELARFNAARVLISVTSLDGELRRVMEPRTSTPEKRLDAMARLNAAGIPTGVMIGPIIPGLNDHEVPRILEEAGKAGAKFAVYTILRLAYGLGPLFEDWLSRNRPLKKDKVMARVRDIHGGKLNNPNFGERFDGEGKFAEEIDFLFHMGRERAGIPCGAPKLTTAHFRRPSDRMPLFESE